MSFVIYFGRKQTTVRTFPYTHIFSPNQNDQMFAISYAHFQFYSLDLSNHKTGHWAFKYPNPFRVIAACPYIFNNIVNNIPVTISLLGRQTNHIATAPSITHRSISILPSLEHAESVKNHKQPWSSVPMHFSHKKRDRNVWSAVLILEPWTGSTTVTRSNRNSTTFTLDSGHQEGTSRIQGSSRGCFVNCFMGPCAPGLHFSEKDQFFNGRRNHLSRPTTLTHPLRSKVLPGIWVCLTRTCKLVLLS